MNILLELKDFVLHSIIFSTDAHVSLFSRPYTYRIVYRVCCNYGAFRCIYTASGPFNINDC